MIFYPTHFDCTFQLWVLILRIIASMALHIMLVAHLGMALIRHVGHTQFVIWATCNNSFGFQDCDRSQLLFVRQRPSTYIEPTTFLNEMAPAVFFRQTKRRMKNVLTTLDSQRSLCRRTVHGWQSDRCRCVLKSEKRKVIQWCYSSMRYSYTYKGMYMPYRIWGSYEWRHLDDVRQI